MPRYEGLHGHCVGRVDELPEFTALACSDFIRPGALEPGERHGLMQHGMYRPDRLHDLLHIRVPQHGFEEYAYGVMWHVVPRPCAKTAPPGRTGACGWCSYYGVMSVIVR